MRQSLFYGVVSFLWPALAVGAPQCREQIKTSFSTVALFDERFVRQLAAHAERIETLCPTHNQDCLAKLKAPMISRAVYATPGGPRVATLTISEYIQEEDGYPQLGAVLTYHQRRYAFKPTIYDSDWGYGIWFDATLLAEQGRWKKIVLPAIGSGWISLPDEGVWTIKAAHDDGSMRDRDDVLSFKGRNIIVLNANRSRLIVRDEQPSDMWCEAGDPPPLKPFKTWVITVKAAYSATCDLQITVPYTRGC